MVYHVSFLDHVIKMVGGHLANICVQRFLYTLMASGGALLFSIYHRVVGDSYNKYCTESVIINLE